MQRDMMKTITTTSVQDCRGPLPFKDEWGADIVPSPPISICPSLETISEPRHPRSSPLKARLPAPTSSSSLAPSSLPSDHSDALLIPPPPKTDPAETKQLWNQVYTEKNQLLMAWSVSSASRTVSSGHRGILIDDSFHAEDVDKHFGCFNTGTTTTSRDDTSRELFNLICHIKQNEACDKHEELKDAVQTYLAPRHVVSATDGISTWRSERFLKVNLSRENNLGPQWQQLRVRSQNQNQNQRQDQTKASAYPPPTASVTYWLRRQPCPLVLEGQLRWRFYSIDGYNDHVGVSNNAEEVSISAAVCPYLSIEYQANGETMAQTAERLAKAAGDALYNRFRLHEEKNAGEQYVAGDWENVRHYGITIGWEGFIVWLVKPEEPGDAGTGLEVAPGASVELPAPHRMTTATERHARGESLVARSNRSGRLLPQQRQTSRPALISGLAVAAGLIADGKSPNSTLSGMAQPDTCQDSLNIGGTQRRWQGGRMTKLASMYHSQPSIARLAQWIRNIHRWGTTAYADAVERDFAGLETPARVVVDEGGGQNDLQSMARDETDAWQRED